MTYKNHSKLIKKHNFLNVDPCGSGSATLILISTGIRYRLNLIKWIRKINPGPDPNFFLGIRPEVCWVVLHQK